MLSVLMLGEALSGAMLSVLMVGDAVGARVSTGGGE
jgi:hypothetical protein